MFISAAKGSWEPLSNNIDQSNTDALPMAKVREHIVRKAGYKLKTGDQFVRIGFWARTKKLAEGNNADARYHRCKYESTQLLAASFMAAKARNRSNGQPSNQNIGDDAILKNSFYRQDNFKFKKELLDRETVSGSKRNQWAHRLCRWAHTANGLNEIAAAPTGMSVKSAKNITAPHAHEKGMSSHWQTLSALPIIGLCISASFWGPSAAFIASGGAVLASWVKPVVVSFSAAGAVLALTSLTLGAASNALMDKTTLSKDILTDISKSETKYLGRLLTLLNDVEKNPEALKLLNMALSDKIPEKYILGKKQGSNLAKFSDAMHGVRNDANSVLVDQLLKAIKDEKSNARAMQKLEQAIGDYLTKNDPLDDRSGLIDIDTLAGRKQTTRRESHFLALTNLIEHKRTDEDIDPTNYKNDLRQHFQGGTETFRQKGLLGIAKVVGAMGFNDSAEKLRKISAKSWASSVQKNRDMPQNARKHYSSMDKILANPHQYGAVTRNCARIADGLRVFNYAVVMSLNYLGTRPCMPVFSLLQRAITGGHASRSLQFSFGRFWSSTAWAFIDVFALIGPLSAIGALPVSFHAGAMPLSIAANSTAFQMLGVGILSLLPMAAMHLALKIEGWKGDIVPELEAANSSRKPLSWSSVS